MSRAWPEYGIHAPDLPGLLIPTDRQDGCMAECHLAGCGRDQPTTTCIHKEESVQTRAAVVSQVLH